ncbi:MAG: hypothetical protein SH821_05365 [Phototrophicales bacterium]|nr:hypothetical protein [Phototrophicales bacterium]
MRQFNRVFLMMSMGILALAMVACSTGGGAVSPEIASKNWIEAFFRADGETLRANMCNVQSAALTDGVLAQLAQGLGSAGSTLDLSGLTYSYNQATSNVTIAGMVRVSLAGQTVERSLDLMQLDILPVVQEDGGWKVCLNLLR